jgi:hypothetical protein
MIAIILSFQRFVLQKEIEQQKKCKHVASCKHNHPSIQERCVKMYAMLVSYVKRNAT